MLTLGVDVGVTGAIAALDSEEQLVGVDDLPVMVHGAAKWIDAEELLQLIRRFRERYATSDRPVRAMVEHVHAMPKLGTVAANSKGMTMGSVLAALQIAGVAIELVAPQTWKRALGLISPQATDTQKKRASLTKARMLFPTAELDLSKHHNRAEALLIAHWAVRNRAVAARAA